MQAAVFPPDESQRVAALDALRLQEWNGHRFDQVTQIAADIFEAPMAFISFVESDRQWFKAKVGLDAAETPRAISFCAHAILGDGPLVIPDARLDPRFADNPLVTGAPFLRFYMGHPLRAPGGEKVGTLCIADHVPREMSAAQMRALPRLAALIEQELQMGDVIDAQQALLSTQDQLLVAQRRLDEELAEAAKYVRSLIPPPWQTPVAIDWRFQTSDVLGGDFLGYHSLPNDRIALYILDVCGHGIGSALLAVVVLDVLRTRTLTGLELDDPAAVLTTLNREFPMARHGRFFTIWYGVLDLKTGELTYSTAGHPAAILLRGEEPLQTLATSGIPIGCAPDVRYENGQAILRPGDRLYLYSDGAYELRGNGWRILGLTELADVFQRASRQPKPLDAAMEALALLNGSAHFTDDVALLELRFPPSPDS